jgi:hypothetical protein
MDAATRNLVRRRAGERCEYCRMPDGALDLPFHVEHIVAKAHGKDDGLENLAWACARCNLRKGPNLITIDPDSGGHVDLFNPRTMAWRDHFVVRDFAIEGVTPIGRGTARLLDMNGEQRLRHRQELIEQGDFDAN